MEIDQNLVELLRRAAGSGEVVTEEPMQPAHDLSDRWPGRLLCDTSYERGDPSGDSAL